jgi:hypothetical protein
MIVTGVGSPPLADVTSDGLCTGDSVIVTPFSLAADLAESGTACAAASAAEPATSVVIQMHRLARAARKDMEGVGQ